MNLLLKLDTAGNAQPSDNNNRSINLSSIQGNSLSEPINIVFHTTTNATTSSESHNISENNDNSITTMLTVNKPDIVYSNNQIKIQHNSNIDNNNSNSSVSNSSSVNAASGNKSITAVGTKNKIDRVSQKILADDDTAVSRDKNKALQEIICVTTKTHSLPQYQQQQQQKHQIHQQNTKAHIVSCSTPLIITNSINPTDATQSLSKVSVDNVVITNQHINIQPTYELVESNNVDSASSSTQQQHQLLSDVIQSTIPQRVLGTTLKSSTTTIGSIQRLSTKPTTTISAQAANIHKVKTITGVNSQGVITKNFISKVQGITKSQTLATAVQQGIITTPITQTITSNNLVSAQRIQQNNQKNFSNQNLQNQVAFVDTKLHTINNNNNKNNINSNNNNNIATQSAEQVQTCRKVAGLFQKTVVQRQSQHSKSTQSIVTTNNVQKGTLCGIQKNAISDQSQHQSASSNPHSGVVQQPRTQIITSLQKSQTAVVINNSTRNPVIGNICKSSSVPNVSKISANAAVAIINKSQLASQSHANIQHSLQIQHVIPHTVQPQITQKQQPKLNIIQQNATLTSLPVNQKGSVVVNAKIQPQQSQMVLRVGPIKSHPINSQSGNSVKCISQKVANTLKTNSHAHPQVALQQATLNRNTINAQPIKIIQQSQQSLPTGVISNSQIIQKQSGTIKTIPPLKSPQKSNQLKTAGIKTSLNTNVNTIKCQASNATVVHQKTTVRTLGSQQINPSNIMIHKNQTVKIQSSNVQQKQIITTSQYPQQVLRTQQSQIKTIIPVVLPENHKEPHFKADVESQPTKIEESQDRCQSPVRRMPLPYECLQFVLQDHNYGAPPPRTPPPAISPSHPKQQPINGTGAAALQHTFMYNQAVNNTNTVDDAASAISSEAGREAEPEGEETETAPEGEGDDEDSVTRCICDFEHDDGYMICCDRCLVWQHVDCMGIDRQNIPEEYLCEICRPRRVDRTRARTLQLRKREEILQSDTSSDTSSTSSADTDITGSASVSVTTTTAAAKKRPIQQQHQSQLPGSRRKSDTSAQTKKINNNHNSNNSSTNSNNTNNNISNTSSNSNDHHHNSSNSNNNDNISNNNSSTTNSNNSNHNNIGSDEINTNINITSNDNNDKSNSENNNSNNNSNTNNTNSGGSSNNNSGNNNNNQVTKRQKREQHPRQTNLSRKKETVKRGPGKRKVKRRVSLNGENDSQDSWGSTNMAPLRQWIERYEEAVTNHYSPELRARLSSIKVNGTYSDLRQNSIGGIVSGKCRLNVHSNNLKFLVATMYLPLNTPVVELRGKYMLSTQHRPSHHQSQHGRQHTQRPGPFVFFYRLPREGTEVCVDTRTYGNEARFVRRSCKPNAEVKHCIEKGTLHLYIVTTTAIEKNAEITIRHEQHDFLLSPNTNSSLTQLACACGNTKTCQIANNLSGGINFGSSSGKKGGNNGALIENTTTDGRERRRRNRRNTVGDDNNDSISTTVSNNSVLPTQQSSSSTSISSNSTTPIASSSAAAPLSVNTKRLLSNPTSSVSANSVATPTISKVSSSPSSSSSKEESSIPVSQSVHPAVSSSPSNSSSTHNTKKEIDKRKLTREERKMEAIMKAFERLEKAEQRKQEVQARNAQRKESGAGHSDIDETPINHPTKPKQQHIDRTVRRKRRKGRTRTITYSGLHGQTNRRSRLNSADSDLSSCEENNIIMMQSPPQSSCLPTNRDLPFSQRRNSSNNNNNSNKKQDDDSNVVDGMINQESSSVNNQAIPTAAGLLLALANSSVSGTSSPPLQQPAPSKSPTCDSGASSSSQSSTPSTPLSSACLLVAAAVGPLAPGFKFPKTKKVMMNEWLRESPDPLSQTHIQMSHELPSNATIPQLPPSSSPSSSSPSNSSNNRTTDFLRQPSDPTSEFLTQSYAAKSLATLVQAANSVSGICDSPPQQRKQAAVTQNAAGPVSSGSAKKRWLRQAISEECDSPNSRPESPPNEMVAPPKKRRIARESISSDNYTPPTTPTLLLADAGPTNSALCSTENDFIEQPQSPIMLDEPPKNDYENSVDVKNSINEFKYYSMNNMKHSDIDEFHEVKVENKLTIGDYKQHMSDELIDTVDEKNDDIIQSKSAIKCESDYSEPIKVESNFVLLSPVKKESSLLINDNNLNNTEVVNNAKNVDISLNDSNSSIGVVKFDNELINTLQQTTIKHEYSDNSHNLSMVLDASHESSENQSFESDDKLEKYNKIVKSEDCLSSDEFDVEAQMKKITGDDGNDYKENIDSSLDKDKSMDGIEGLMDSSREDSESEDRDLRDLRSNDDTSSLKDLPIKERSYCDYNKFSQLAEPLTDDKDNSIDDLVISKNSNQISGSTNIISSNDPIFDSIDFSNINCESIEEPPKIFQSIPPLSERIRKKPESSTTRNSLDLEALSHIESSIDMESVEIIDNDNDKSHLSSLSEITTNREEIADVFINPEKIKEHKNPSPSPEHHLETPNPSDTPQQCITEDLSKITMDVEQTTENAVPSKIDEKISQSTPSLLSHLPVSTSLSSPLLLPPPPPPPVPQQQQQLQTLTQQSMLPVQINPQPPSLPPLPPPPPPQEIRRLKDPRTAIPNELRVTSPKEIPPPVKRKVRTLSISEYRKRKQQSSETPPEPEPSNDASSSEKSPGRGRSDSASSGTSSLSSDEDNTKAAHDSSSSFTTLPPFTNAENEDRKGGEDGTIGWSAAPTLVERQRENLTERLKREFGLFLSDDEEERARKQGLTAEAILKARKEGLQLSQITGALVTNYAIPQLPPQPYIPPPGSAALQFSQYSVKSTLTGQYQNLDVPQPIPPPNYPVPPPSASSSSSSSSPPPPPPPSSLSTVSKTVTQFLVPQAPPGSNPYPPPQFVPTTSSPTSRFPTTTPTPQSPSQSGFNTCTQSQKPFYNHPNSMSRS